MDTLPARSRPSIAKQDLWHQHHVFAPPASDIQHAYATRYSTTHSHSPPAPVDPNQPPSLTSTATFHTDQASGATHNHAYTHLRGLPATASTYVAHYPRSAAASSSASTTSAPVQYERHDRLPAITFPSPIATADAYYHDDTKHRPSAYVVSNRYAHNQPRATQAQSTSHAAHRPERPTSAPADPYAPPPPAHSTHHNGYTHNNAHSRTPDYAYADSQPRCRTGRFASEYDERINHSAHLAEHAADQHRTAVGRPAGQQHSGFTRRMAGGPPCEGVGTEGSGLRVFAGLGREVGAGVGRDGGWEEKQQLELRGPAFDSSVPCVANGGLRHFYSTTSQRHYTPTSQPPATAATASTSSIQPVLHSGFTHNAHLIPATARLNSVQSHNPAALHGRALSAATAGSLATDGRPSHADYGAPEARRVEVGGAVDGRRVASAYSREHAVRVTGVDREERRWERTEDGQFVLQPRAIERLEYMHPTVRAMMEVQLTEKRGDVKNYGTDLDVFDRDWVADVAEEDESS